MQDGRDDHSFIFIINNIMDHKRKNIQNCSSDIVIFNITGFGIFSDKKYFFPYLSNKSFTKSLLFCIIP